METSFPSIDNPIPTTFNPIAASTPYRVPEAEIENVQANSLDQLPSEAELSEYDDALRSFYGSLFNVQANENHLQTQYSSTWRIDMDDRQPLAALSVLVTGDVSMSEDIIQRVEPNYDLEWERAVQYFRENVIADPQLPDLDSLNTELDRSMIQEAYLGRGDYYDSDDEEVGQWHVISNNTPDVPGLEISWN